jgi:N-carbamoyl-L-amino-acid hydrolase
MAEEGFDPEAVRAGKCLLPPESIAAYLELHIEQGPVLEAEGIPLGVVTGLPGSLRLRDAAVFGEYNHSGATPRKYRADAAVALAELVYRLDEHWARLEARGQRLVCTFCTMGTTAEAGFTKVPGEARFQLDVRSTDAAALAAMEVELQRLVAEIGPRRWVRFELGRLQKIAPTPMDAEVQTGLARAAEALGIEHWVMPSGGGHDAASFAQAGVPAGMLFVRNQHGSHNPNEAMRMEDFAKGAAVVTRWAAAMAG